MNGTIWFGRIAGVRVGFNWSLLVVFWLISWSLADVRFPAEFPDYEDTTYWSAGVFTALVFFLSLLAHEMGHALVARREQVEVEGITLWLFGGVAKLRGEALTPGSELRIAIVGPLVSLLLAGAFLALGAAFEAFGSSNLFTGVLSWLGRINAILAIFNLIPAFPLDGGRVLRAWLWGRKDRISATVWAGRIGRGFGGLMIAFGIYQFVSDAQLGGLWMIFLGWFLIGAARAEETNVLLRDVMKRLIVRDVMSRDVDPPPFRHEADSGVITTTPEESIDKLLGRMPDRLRPRAVVLEDGQVVGFVSAREINKALDMADARTGRSAG